MKCAMCLDDFPRLNPHLDGTCDECFRQINAEERRFLECLGTKGERFPLCEYVDDVETAIKIMFTEAKKKLN